ncbi:MAG: UDP-N-acetylglucosamine 2-epimerase [archaeon]|nr:UDP-N-acetylglucosamine 2-epimerase [archaeon]MCR4323971.1 UDP-N-acetylglucosamine 2-epimerase [Nanoarchaeota archaeon]
MNLKDVATIAIVIGTRAELIKTFPVMLELQQRKVPYYFIHTGQHNLGGLCKLFSVKVPDAILTNEPKKSSKFNSKQIKAMLWTFGIIKRIRKELKELKSLKYVIYHGDTMTTASAAVASSKFLNPFKKYKNIHLEAGLRSWDNMEPFPEEISRRIAGRFSDILFAPSIGAGENLRRLKNKKVLIFGNTIVDSADYALNLAKKRKTKPLKEGRFAVVTIHRHENLKNKERMKKIIEVLSSINIPTYFFVHDNTLNKLNEFGLLNELKNIKNFYLKRPSDYVEFIYQLSKCSLVVCDGGSMQEESLIFGKPCVLLRKSTERPEGLETNFQFLSKLDVPKAKEKIGEYLSKDFKIKKYKNPYGEKGLSKKIVDFLVK